MNFMYFGYLTSLMTLLLRSQATEQNGQFLQADSVKFLSYQSSIDFVLIPRHLISNLTNSSSGQPETSLQKSESSKMAIIFFVVQLGLIAGFISVCICIRKGYCDCRKPTRMSQSYERPQLNENPMLHQIESSLQSEKKKNMSESANIGDVESGQCCICMENQARVPREALGCGHSFHRECLRQWRTLRYNQTCPLCRSPLSGGYKP